jgi:hypothetical protein
MGRSTAPTPALVAVVLAGLVGLAGPGVIGPGRATAAPGPRAAAARGDVDEAIRRGVIAGPAAIERRLASPDRLTALAAIAAAPAVADPLGLLPALAGVAGGRDRRTAVPAASAAGAIARTLARRAAPDPDDDIPDDELAGWQAAWQALARRDDRWIELRVAALDVAAALAEVRHQPLVWTEVLADPDPALRRAALELLAPPLDPALRSAVAARIADDAEPRVAIAAAAALCSDLVSDPPGPTLAAIGPRGLARLRAALAEVALDDIGAIRDAARCLAADPDPASGSALAALRQRASGALRAALEPRR